MRLTGLLRFVRTLMPATGGAVSIEYALIASLVSVAILGGVEAMSGAVSELFNYVGGEVGNAVDVSSSDGNSTVDGN